MRGKRAKQLRRIAEENTVGKPTCSYVHKDFGVKPIKLLNGSIFYIPRITRLLSPDCTRREYQMMKRKFKRFRTNIGGS